MTRARATFIASIALAAFLAAYLAVAVGAIHLPVYLPEARAFTSSPPAGAIAMAWFGAVALGIFAAAISGAFASIASRSGVGEAAALALMKLAGVLFLIAVLYFAVAFARSIRDPVGSNVFHQPGGSPCAEFDGRGSESPTLPRSLPLRGGSSERVDTFQREE